MLLCWCVQGAVQSGGALQRSATSVVPLDELNGDRDVPPSDASSHNPDSDDEAIFADFEANHLASAGGSSSSSRPRGSDTHQAASSSGGGGVGSSSSSQQQKSSKPKARLVAAFKGRSSKQGQQQQQQQPQSPQHGPLETSSNPLQSRISAPSGHTNGSTHMGGSSSVYVHRSRSASFRSSSAPGHKHDLSDGGTTAPGVVPGVAVARIQGCWLSHLNIDNQRWVVPGVVGRRLVLVRLTVLEPLLCADAGDMLGRLACIVPMPSGQRFCLPA